MSRFFIHSVVVDEYILLKELIINFTTELNKTKMLFECILLIFIFLDERREQLALIQKQSQYMYQNSFGIFSKYS